jgi:hypothetical protein
MIIPGLSNLELLMAVFHPVKRLTRPGAIMIPLIDLPDYRIYSYKTGVFL